MNEWMKKEWEDKQFTFVWWFVINVITTNTGAFLLYIKFTIIGIKI